jgi:hypothetical protein
MADAEEIAATVRSFGTVSERLAAAFKGMPVVDTSVSKQLAAALKNMPVMDGSVSKQLAGLVKDMPRLDVPVSPAFETHLADLPPNPAVTSAAGIAKLNGQMEGLVSAVMGLHDATVSLAQSAATNDRRMIRMTGALVGLTAVVVALTLVLIFH